MWCLAASFLLYVTLSSQVSAVDARAREVLTPTTVSRSSLRSLYALYPLWSQLPPHPLLAPGFSSTLCVLPHIFLSLSIASPPSLHCILYRYHSSHTYYQAKETNTFACPHSVTPW
ncbi:hypothetical protein OF83DRAFT_924785 [Amylostereum chailletii]|nr:hypothetical protein OF83DRAFT_924785 [Amylostereum chailletii]